MTVVQQVQRAIRRTLTSMASRRLLWRTRRLVSHLYLSWRRSIQLRVVTLTMLLGMLMIFAVGSILLAGIWNGLVQSRLQEAFDRQQQVERSVDAYLGTASYESLDQVNQRLRDTIDRAQSLVAANDGKALLVRAQGERSRPGILPAFSIDKTFLVRDLPQDLRTAVNSSEQLQAKRLAIKNFAAEDSPGLAVGSRITLPGGRGVYELYTIYRLDREREILSLVQSTFLVGGFALVLLLGGIAYVLVRAVVTPVRSAVSIAEQLAAGSLDRRMPVRGIDDFARLGRAFNDMAISLERQITQLEDLSRMQHRFVSDVSHELRTPLTTIRMASHVLNEDRSELDALHARTVELMHTQIERFERLLSDLLEISRFDAGAAELDIERSNLSELVQQVCEGLVPAAEHAGSTLELSLPAEEVLTEIDMVRVERILRNLVSNAIEHGEAQQIDIVVAQGDGACAVTVRDYGIGLSEDERARVFGRFWRADPARARTMGGTGLGLAIALEDTHLHGGWLQVWGQPGKGANFRLTLPLHADSPVQSSPLPLVPVGVTQAAVTSGEVAQ